MKFVLVTGATGFIGQRLCDALEKTDSDVRILGRTKPEGAEDFYHWDLSQPVPDEALNGIDTVFHLAGKAHVLSSDYHDEAEYFPVNISATRKLLEAAKSAGIRRFVYFSSVKAVGYNTETCSDETCEDLPDSMYGRSKRMAEQLVLHGGFVPEPVVIRPVMVYGNTEKGNLPKMIRAIRDGRFPPLSDTRNKRSMVHVDDIVQAALLAARHPAAAGNIYIVTDGQAYSTRQMYVWICEALQKPVPGWRLPFTVLKVLAMAGDVIGKIRGRRFVFDTDAMEKLTGCEFYSSEKIQNELGFKAQYHLKETLPEIVRYLERGL